MGLVLQFNHHAAGVHPYSMNQSGTVDAHQNITGLDPGCLKTDGQRFGETQSPQDQRVVVQKNLQRRAKLGANFENCLDLGSLPGRVAQGTMEQEKAIISRLVS